MEEIVARITVVLKSLLSGIFLLMPEGHCMEVENQFKAPHGFIKITFPEEIEKLKEVVLNDSPYINISIPCHAKPLSFQKQEDLKKCIFPKLGGIQRLTIEHSLRSDRGYLPIAMEPLKYIVKNSQNLQKIVLPQALADDFLPCIPAGVEVFLDCGCAYSVTDTIYPKKWLENTAHNILKYYQDLYPEKSGFRISLLPLKDPFKIDHK